MVKASLLIAEREILAQVRTKSFLISTAVLLGAVLVSIVLGAVFADRAGSDGTDIAVVPSVSSTLEDVDGLDLVDADDEAAALQLVRDGDVVAAVLPDEGSPLGIRVVALDSMPTELVASLAVAPEVELLDPSDTDEGLRYLVSFGFGLVFLMSATGFGSTIAQNTVTEKQTRIVELLLAAAPARALLAGKILGNSALAFGQTAAIAAVSVVGLVVTGQEDLLAVLGAPLVWFVVFFVVGFVLLASLFAASASLVSRVEDVGSVMSPVMMLTMIPYFMVVFFNDNLTVLKAMSYVPFSAPVGMPVRLFLGEAQWWEPLVSLGLLAVTTVAVIALGARIYERSVLRMGPRVKWSEALRGS
jgi:ABC-2 type transport system permease protein